MEYTISELKKKKVVNLADGKELGKVIDVSFSYPSAKVEGVIITSRKMMFGGEKSLLKLCCIEKIGEDVILVKVSQQANNQSYQELEDSE